MKIIYESPEIEIVKLQTEDIVTLSNGGSTTDGKTEGWGW